MSADFFTRLATRAVDSRPGLRAALGSLDLGPLRLDTQTDAEPLAPNRPPSEVARPVVGRLAAPPSPPVATGPDFAPPRLETLVRYVAATPPPATPEPARVETSVIVAAQQPPAPAASSHTLHEATSHHESTRIEQSVERVVERFVELRPALTPATAADRTVAVRPEPNPSSAPTVEIHIGRLEIGEPRRRPAGEPAVTPPRQRTPPAALGLAEYLSAREAR
jgi:hypothetical protein